MFLYPQNRHLKFTDGLLWMTYKGLALVKFPYHGPAVGPLVCVHEFAV